MLKTLATTFAFSLFTAPLAAQTSDELYDLLRVNDYLDVMIEEGLASATEIEMSFLGGDQGPNWDQRVAGIYDAADLEEQARALLAESLDDVDIAAVYDFMSSDLGTKVIELELEARRAMLDPDAEEAARFAGSRAAEDNSEIYQSLLEMIEAGNLIERNVEAAMNAQLVFLLEVAANSNSPMLQDDGQILSAVSGQESEIRADVISWLLGFMLVAYTPLEPEELNTHIEFMKSDAGHDLNTAMFDVFGVIYQEITGEMGATVGFFASESTL